MKFNFKIQQYQTDAVDAVVSMKRLIIVCEEKCRQYGDYLAQLISLEDDTEDETVGTKDGEVAAQV